MRRTRWLVIMMMLIVMLAGIQPQAINAADPPTYFPETGHSLGGGFRDFWNAHGGLPIFGYPLTEEYRVDNGRTTQWFERARFEVSPSGVIELGLLGTEFTQDKIFPQIPPRANDANHRYFPETKHMIMWGFKTIWETKGGLQIFGYPISEEIMEVLPADEEWHTVQYFERARFEYWPNFPPGERVLISDLGRQMVPDMTQPPPPPPPPPGLPPNVNATVDPNRGPIGTKFHYNAFGFEPGELINLWASGPNGEVVYADFNPTVDPDGSIASSNVTFNPQPGASLGVWALSAEGQTTKRVAIGYLEITGDPTPPGQLPPDQNARVEPREGPPGTEFRFYAGGFVANETVAVAVLNQWDEIISEIIYVPADGNGSLDYAQITLVSNDQIPQGVYRIYAEGENGRVAYAYFRITGGNATAYFASPKLQSQQYGKLTATVTVER